MHTNTKNTHIYKKYTNTKDKKGNPNTKTSQVRESALHLSPSIFIHWPEDILALYVQLVHNIYTICTHFILWPVYIQVAQVPCTCHQKFFTVECTSHVWCPLSINIILFNVPQIPQCTTTTINLIILDKRTFSWRQLLQGNSVASEVGRELYLCCICVAFVLYLCCICVVFVLHLCCICVVFVVYLCCICIVFAMETAAEKLCS